jgi:hypothetical protein
MNLSRPLAALVALLPLFAGAGHPEDSWRERGGPRVILYEHPNFQGGAVVLRPGDQVENFARWDFDNGRRANDRVSSIRVEGGAELMLFADANFRGEALRVTSDIRDLSRGDRGGVRFDDRASSVRVALAGGRDRGGTGDRGPRPAPERPRPTPPAEVDYEKVIRRAYHDVLERDADVAGLRHYRSLMIERRWTEVQVRDHLRQSEEYRGPLMTRRLNRIYQDVLGRDVDPRGFDHYRNKLIEHAWSDEDIRRDLRGSAEYRNRLTTQPVPEAERPRRSEVEEPR